MILVVTDSAIGKISRYSCTGKTKKLTHVSRAERPLTFTSDFVEMYRMKPPEEFELFDPDPHATTPLRSARAA